MIRLNESNSQVRNDYKQLVVSTIEVYGLSLAAKLLNTSKYSLFSYARKYNIKLISTDEVLDNLVALHGDGMLDGLRDIIGTEEKLEDKVKADRPNFGGPTGETTRTIEDDERELKPNEPEVPTDNDELEAELQKRLDDME